MAYSSEEDLQRLAIRKMEMHRQFADLREKYITRTYKVERAKEYAQHGLSRRLGTLVRSVDRVFELLPPENGQIPERDVVIDVAISIQSFVMNAFGCLDNLAWIWVHERQIKDDNGKDLDPKKVGLGARAVRRSFTNEFRAFLDSRQEWFENLKNFRDSLAHRIPLYIPPFLVRDEDGEEYKRIEVASLEALARGELEEYDRLQAEQMKLGFFRPWMIHSIFEDSPRIIFHPQLLADYVTVDEYARTMLEELDK